MNGNKKYIRANSNSEKLLNNRIRSTQIRRSQKPVTYICASNIIRGINSDNDQNVHFYDFRMYVNMVPSRMVY